MLFGSQGEEEEEEEEKVFLPPSSSSAALKVSDGYKKKRTDFSFSYSNYE